MHISGRFEETDFESEKADIENMEADIESQKADIRKTAQNKSADRYVTQNGSSKMLLYLDQLQSNGKITIQAKRVMYVTMQI